MVSLNVSDKLFFPLYSSWLLTTFWTKWSVRLVTLHKTYLEIFTASPATFSSVIKDYVFVLLILAFGGQGVICFVSSLCATLPINQMLIQDSTCLWSLGNIKSYHSITIWKQEPWVFCYLQSSKIIVWHIYRPRTSNLLLLGIWWVASIQCLAELFIYNISIR